MIHPRAIAARAATAARSARERWVAASREDRLFALVFALCAACALVPIWRVRFLPLLDQPNHISSVYIWHYFDDPAARLKEYYELNIQPVPYFIYHLLVHGVAFVAGIEAANKIVLSAYALSIPAAALLFTRRTRRSPWLSILTFPLAYSYSWSYGFQPFNIGLAAFLLAVVAVDAFIERPRASVGVLAAILGLACDLGHPLALLALYVSVPLLLAASRPPWKRALATVLLLAPATALFAWQVLRPQTMLSSRATGPLYEGQHLPVLEMLRLLPAHTLDSVSGHVDLVVFYICLGSAVLLFVTGLMKRYAAEPLREGEPRARYYRGAALMAAMLACYLAVPLHLSKPFDWWFVSGRFAPLVCFFAFLVPGGRVRGARLALVAPAAAAAIALPLYISQKYADFNARARPFVGMVERTRPSANVLFLAMKPRGDEAVNVEAYNQFASWVQILRGGFSGSGWFFTGYPFKLKKELPGPPWYSHERFDPAVHAGPYHYVIVRNESAKRPIFTARNPEWRLAARDGSWALYAREGEP
jgi:hypothetical protein